MEIKSRELHHKKHHSEIKTNQLHEILAQYLCRQVGLDLADSNVSYYVRVSMSTDGLPSASIEITETIINAETNGVIRDG